MSIMRGVGSRLILCLLVILISIVPALAQEAVVTRNVNLRRDPSYSKRLTPCGKAVPPRL
jgi:hypothetical protein